MKILHTVQFYEPHKGGAEEVIKQISEGLVRRGHSVTVATSFLSGRQQKIINGVKIKEFKISGNIVKGISANAKEIKRYQNFLIQGNFDIILNYATHIWTTDLAFPILDNISAKKIFAPCGYFALNLPTYREYFKTLPIYLKKYDSLLYHSKNYRDKIFGDKYELENKAIIIPNGASEEEFQKKINFSFKKKLGINKKHLLITVGNHYFNKNHLFLIRAFLKMKRKDTILAIIGNRPEGSKLKSCWPLCKFISLIYPNIVLVEGENRDVVLSAYQEADIFLFASKVECAPIVMYESFASHLPFISTACGNAKDYVGIVNIVNSPNEMAQKANELLNNLLIKKGVGEKGFLIWQNHYTWHKIVDQYEALYKSLLLD